MPTLTQDDLSRVEGVLQPQRVRFQAVTRLYSSDGNGWEYTGLLGSCAIAVDITQRTYLLKLVNLESHQVVWDHELYDGFAYTTPTPWLICFEGDNYIYGLSFAEESEAKEFIVNILYCKNTPVKTDEEREAEKNARKEEKAKKKKESGGEKKGVKRKVKKLFKGVSNLFKSEKETLTIGGPRNFRHTSHIGWGEDGFSITDLPGEWQDLFAKAGIKKSELENKETANKIIGIITDVMFSQGISSRPSEHPSTGVNSGTNETNTNTHTAPPPPPVSKTAPPPPPPPMMNAPPPPTVRGPPPPSGGGLNESTNTVTTPRGGGGGFLEELQQKSTNLNKGDVPDIKNMSQGQKDTLVDTLSLAMKQIRQDIGDSEESGDDGWSDSE